MDHTTVSRLQHVLQACIMHCACRWNGLVILSQKELKAQHDSAALNRKVLQQEHFPTGFLTGKIGSMIKGLLAIMFRNMKGAFSVHHFG